MIEDFTGMMQAHLYRNIGSGIKYTPTTPLPPSDDQERDDIIKATQLSLALGKTAKVYKEQQNVAAIKNKILEEDVEKLVDREDESDGDEFTDTDDDKKNDDDKHDDAKDNDDDDDHDDHTLIRTQETGSLEIMI
ncbi:hypothetical protein Tco_0401375 [Tanacetum coccineum]